MEQILSQREIDLLLRDLKDWDDPFDENESKQETNPLDEVVPYDLSHPARVVRGRIPAVELVNERFSRIFRHTLSAHLRRPIGVWGRSIELVSFKDFLKSIGYPTSLNLFHMAPLRGLAILALEPRLVYTLVDLIFGGNGKLDSQIPDRDFTAIEVKMIGKVIHSALEDYEKAWSPVAPIRMRLVRTESNPQFASVVPESEIVVMGTFDVEIHQSPMTLTLCIPYSMLEPVRSKLNAGIYSENQETNQATVSYLSKNIENSAVDINVFLGKTQITLRKFLNLKIGDYLTLDQDSANPLNVFVHNIPKYKGFQGNYKGHLAIQISELLYKQPVEDEWEELNSPSKEEGES